MEKMNILLYCGSVDGNALLKELRGKKYPKESLPVNIKLGQTSWRFLDLSVEGAVDAYKELVEDSMVSRVFTYRVDGDRLKEDIVLRFVQQAGIEMEVFDKKSLFA